MSSVNAATISKWLNAYNTSENYPFEYNTVSKTFWCKSCEKAVPAGQKSQLEQHKKSEKHSSNLNLKRKLVQSKLEFKDAKKPCSREEVVGQKLCDTFLAANIPLFKLEHPKLRGFLEEHIGITIPSESTVRKKHLPKSYETAIDMIKKDLDGKRLWMSIDETTDVQKRKVANVILGELSSEGFCKPYLVNCTFLDKTNSGTIARLANDTLNSLWPQFDKDLLKILVSDGAAYMVKAGQDLKIFYPSLVHVTCLCHGLHRICEMVREMFPSVDQLISTCKKVFLKAPARISAFKESCPNLGLPPEPVLSR